MIEFTPSWHVVRHTMLEALKQTGDLCWYCHAGVYAHTMQIALRYSIPLIIWGESLAEYQSWYSYDEKEEVSKERFEKAMSLGIPAEKMFELLGGKVKLFDLYPYIFPKIEALDELGCRSICLGNYIKWDIKAQVKLIKKELGWQGQQGEGWPYEYDYEKMECMYYGIRDYCKWLKRGYGRTNHLCSIDIRNGRMTREKALELEKKYDGKKPASLSWFLDQLGLTEEEFEKIMKKHVIEPHVFTRSLVTGKELPDMGRWL